MENDSEPDREDSEEEVTKSIPPTLLKYIFYRSTTVLNMTVTKVERAMKKMRWERREVVGKCHTYVYLPDIGHPLSGSCIRDVNISNHLLTEKYNY